MDHFETNDVFTQVLRIITRSILPRAIGLPTPAGRLSLDVRGGHAVLCPRIDENFVLDDTLKSEAPRAWEILRAGIGPAMAAANSLRADRDALLRHYARTLARMSSGAAPGDIGIHARPLLQRSAGSQLPAFQPEELAQALFAPALVPAPSTVAPVPETAAPAVLVPGRFVPAFYQFLASRTRAAWLFGVSGEPLGHPPQGSDPAYIEAMAAAARDATPWFDDLDMPERPLMTIFADAGHEFLRCVTIDATHVAAAEVAPTELGSILAAWREAGRVARAQEGGAAAQPWDE